MTHQRQVRGQSLAALHELSTKKNRRVCNKNSTKDGRMTGGAVSFKIETLIQLVEGCNTKFVCPVAFSHFAKREVKEYPQKLSVYLENAFLSGAYTLAKG